MELHNLKKESERLCGESAGWRGIIKGREERKERAGETFNADIAFLLS